VAKPIRKISVKVFTSDHASFETFDFRCDKNHHFGPEAIDEVLGKVIADLLFYFPHNEFKVVPVSRSKFNILPALVHSA